MNIPWRKVEGGVILEVFIAHESGHGGLFVMGIFRVSGGRLGGDGVHAGIRPS
jgi:hypothetical protein